MTFGTLLATQLCLGVLLIHQSHGQCRTDCRCVPESQSTPGVENRCCLSIRENLPSGSPIGNASQLALIADVMPAVYIFSPNDELARALLNFNATTGAITTAAAIDREAISPLVQGDCIGFVVQVDDAGGVPLLTRPGQFGVVIEDINDNHPQFQPNFVILNIVVEENNAPYSLSCESNITGLVNLRATDADTGSNAEVTYKVAKGSGSSLFRVSNPQRPCVTNLVPMDRENTSISYSFVLVAMDGGNPQRSTNLTVIFTLEDVNDNAPVFPNATVNVSVLENTTIGSVVDQFQATDLDLETQPLRYSLMSLIPIPFQINHETGRLNLTRTLDVNTADKYRFTVLAVDSNSVHTSMLSVTITVIDVNEPATLRPPILRTELVEEIVLAENGFIIVIVDNDKSTANTMNEIRFMSGGEYFEVMDKIKFGNQQSFRIRQHTAIDRENVTNATALLSVIIEQMGNPPLEAQFQHNFTILDINDNEPYLITAQINVTEDHSDTQDQGTSTPVRIQLKKYVRDDDAGENGTVTSFSLISVRSISGQDFTENFLRSNALDGVNQIHDGNLLLPKPLDREFFGGALLVTMNFTDGGTPPLSRVESFTIEIIDVNDNAPVFEYPEYTFNLTENRNHDSIIGSVKAADTDDDRTGNGLVVYSLVQDEMQRDFENFTVDRNNGTIRNKQAFNREEKGRFTFYISASDLGTPPRTADVSARVTVVILDVNDEPPAFEMEKYIFYVNDGANVGDFVDTVRATDPDEDPTLNQITYKFLVPTPYFSIDNSTGNIVITKMLSLQDSPYNLTVVACNPGFELLRGTASVSIVVTESSQYVTIISAVSAGAAFILIVAIIFLCCCIWCVRHKLKTGKLEVDGNGAHLNNQKPILKTLPATNRQQRSVKFSTTVDEIHYLSEIGEYSMICKNFNNTVNGNDLSPTLLRTTAVPDSAMNTNSSEIVDYDTSPNLGINSDIPSHYQPQYPRHGRLTSPIILQEELNPSQFSQSTDSMDDDRNSYNSEGNEVESTFSDTPSNVNTSIAHSGWQQIEENDHDPAKLGRHGMLTSPIMLQEELNPSELSQSTGSMDDDRNSYNSEGDDIESTFSDAPSNFNTSIPPFGRQHIEEHHHPAKLGRYAPPPIHPPLDIHHDLHSHFPPVHHMPMQHSSPGHLAELRAHNLAVLNAQYASSSYPPGVPPTEDIRDQSLNSLPHNIHHCHHHISIGSSHTSTLPHRRIQHPLPTPSIHQPPPVGIPHSIVAPAPSNGDIVNYNMSTNLGTKSVLSQGSNSSRSCQTCSDTSTVISDPVFRNLPGSHVYSQISAATSSDGSSVDVAHLMLQANIRSTKL